MKRPARLVLTLLLAAASACAWAAPRMHDLGEGLGYVQITRVPADLPGSKDAQEAKAWVVDLRNAQTDQSQSRTLLAWLRFHSKADKPSIVLLNESTNRLLRELIIDSSLPSLITIAPSSVSFRADILVDTSLEADARAGRSIEEGGAPEELIKVNQAKERWDEAILARERENGGSGIAPQPPDPTAKPDEKLSEAYKPKDQVLARAVQIHRGLVALRVLRPAGTARGSDTH